jgi:hypothetical protein
MESTYLVQRLLSPNPKGIFNPFTFGAGGNGGLSKEAIELVSKIWEFDYMGRGEFEFGAIPKALERIQNYSSEKKSVIGEIKLAKPIFYLCESEEKVEVEKTIRKIAKNKQNLLEPALLDEVVKGNENYQKYKGWLELNNGFMFFTDKEMFDKTLNLFGINQLEKAVVI